MPRVPANTEYRVSAAFRKRILAIMEDSDCFSNRAFAERTGVSLPVIARAALFGIVPTTRALIKIADALELSFSYLLGSTEKNEFIPSAAPLRLPRGWKNCAKNGRQRTARSRRACPSRARIFTNGEKTTLFPLPSICLRSHPILPFRPTICSAERTIKTDFPFSALSL